MEMAMKAKWYHMVTLKMRVSRISSISVDKVTMNNPPYIFLPIFSIDSISAPKTPCKISKFKDFPQHPNPDHAVAFVIFKKVF
jgi:hypothetical protein